MLELYIANKNYSSWSLRPWLLMSELQIPFVEKQLIFGSEEWAAYRQRFNTVPCLIDGASVIWDSLAIAEYLAETYAAVWPGEQSSRAWARSAAAEMHSSFSALRNGCPMSCGVTVELSSRPKELQRDIDRIDALWQTGLERFGGPFLAGSTFTAVDAFYAPVAYRIRSFQLKLSPNSMDYARSLLARDTLQAWEAAGLAETVREAGHEAEILALGQIIEDRRVPAHRVLHQ